MRFHIIVTGRNCADRVDACLSSIAAQRDHSFHVSIVDDCSDDGTDMVVRSFLEHGSMAGDVSFVRTPERRGAMCNQFEAWTDPDVDWDVAVWCDLDDALAHPDVLNRVAVEYERGARLTYGSYESVPHSATCPAVWPFPKPVIDGGGYRAFLAARGGIAFNHLRTVHRSVMERVTVADCTDDDGVWWMAAPDHAVMVPALEHAGSRHVYIPDVLYRYTSDRLDAEWRQRPGEVNRVHAAIAARVPSVPVSADAVRAARFEAVEARKQRKREAARR